MTPGDALLYRFQNSRFLGIQGKLVSPVSPVARGGAHRGIPGDTSDCGGVTQRVTGVTVHTPKWGRNDH